VAPKRSPSRLKLVGDSAGEPLAEFVVRRGGVGADVVLAAIERGGAFLRGRRERDPSAPVRAGDKVEVSLEAPAPGSLDRSRVLHLDARLLAIDKPAGIAAQEELAGGPALPDLCSALLAAMGERETQALLVHRLDKGTTGVTLLARTRSAQAELLEDFRERRVRKEYRALVAGVPERELLQEPIDGRPASTSLEVVERFALGAHVAAFPETGRTHQVRLHLRAAGAPLLGDRQHGGPAFLTRADGARIDFERPLLHARAVAVRGLRVEARLPEDFEAALKWLRR
jgi:23S rRNA pseudouridine1911/1915/1917 synthase